MVSVSEVKFTGVGVLPDKVIWTVVFYVVHSVKTLALTMIFLWIGSAPSSNVTELLVRVMNSMTFCVYKKELRRVAEVVTTVPVL